MASKLNVSTPRKRSDQPPGPMRARREGGSHETKWNSTITLERQDLGVNPLAAKGAQDKIMDAQPGAVRRALTRRKD